MLAYTPSAASTQQITSSFGGDVSHDSSQGQASIDVATRSTSTAVDCEPQGPSAGSLTTCTVTVTDTGAGSGSPPGGSVGFQSAGAGTFTPASSCTLTPGAGAASTCSVSFVPTHAGSPVVVASFGQTTVYSASSGQATVDAAKHATSTTLVCSPSTAAPGTPTTCTATVSDGDANPIMPGGSFHVSPDGAGSFTGPSTCTLSPAGTSSASCTVTFTTSQHASQHLTGAYDGDGDHNPSGSTTTLTGVPLPSAPGSTTGPAGTQPLTQPPTGPTGPAGVTPVPGTFSLHNIKFNRKRGTVSLQVTVPAAGRLVLSGAGIKQIARSAKRAATFNITLRPRGAALATLRRRGSLVIHLHVSFKPKTGRIRALNKALRLFRSKSGG